MKASPASRATASTSATSTASSTASTRPTGRCSGRSRPAARSTPAANFHGDNVLVGSHDSTLYCLDPDGKKVWEFQIDGPVNGAAAVVGDRTFVAGCDSILHVIDATNGKELGTVDLGGQAGRDGRRRRRPRLRRR